MNRREFLASMAAGPAITLRRRDEAGAKDRAAERWRNASSSRRSKARSAGKTWARFSSMARRRRTTWILGHGITKYDPDDAGAPPRTQFGPP